MVAALATATLAPSIGVGKGVTLPALRTVRAVFPHTALQSLVPSLGVSRVFKSCLKGDEPLIREEGIPCPLGRRYPAPIPCDAIYISIRKVLPAILARRWCA